MKYFANSDIKHFCIFLIGCLMCSYSFGQYKSGGFGRLMVGGSFLNINSLDDALVAEGHTRIGNNFFTLGLGYEQFFNRISLGFDTYNYMIRGNYLDRFQPNLSYHYALIKAGFVLYQADDRLSIYPTAGIGGGRVGIRRWELTQNILQREAAYGGMVEFAINARKYSILGDDSPYHIETGFSLGYMKSVGGNWTLNGLTTDSNGLVANPDAIFFRLSLGMGKWRN